MSIGSYLLARAAGLPKRLSGARHTRNIRVRMRDGLHLETDLYVPRKPGRYPTILVRIPYGLVGFGAAAESYAERGYNVVMQACRGTSKSEGQFQPLVHERDDGLDTLDWIEQQPFYDGRLGTSGPSYLGYAHWAICDALPQHSAMAIRVSSAEFHTVNFPGGTFHLGLWLSWLQVIEGIRADPLRFARKIARGLVERRTLEASMTLPLIEADKRATGHVVPFWKRWLSDSIGHPEFWEPFDHTHRLGPLTPPTSFMSGWYDFMLDQLLRDYQHLVDSGGSPHLTVGPWFHVSGELHRESLRDSLMWMNAKLKGDPSGIRERPVRIHIGGRNVWREYDAYPPGAPDTQIWHLHPGQVLSQRPVRSSEPERYRYDPADPTPNLGGAIFAFTGMGPLDQASLQARNDVLVYTSDPLFTPVTIIGNPRATIYVRGSRPDFDIFVKLCDVDPAGRSINICDGILRHTSAEPLPGDAIAKMRIRLHATAHSFERDHRLRLIVASGAHPRYARNTGTNEPFGLATKLVPVDIEIFNDSDHPSAIDLPVFEL